MVGSYLIAQWTSESISLRARRLVGKEGWQGRRPEDLKPVPWSEGALCCFQKPDVWQVFRKLHLVSDTLRW